MSSRISHFILLFLVATGAGCDREASDWKTAVAQNTAEAFDAYASAHPSGPHASEARSRAEQLHEEHDWKALSKPPRLADVEHFLKRYPNGSHSTAVVALKADAQFTDDIERYVSAWGMGISIPGDAPRFPPADFAVTALPFRTTTIALTGDSLNGQVQVSGEGHFTSNGRLARGTDAFKPLSLMTTRQNGQWFDVSSMTIDKDGILRLTDSTSQSYRIRFGPSLKGSIEELTR